MIHNSTTHQAYYRRAQRRLGIKPLAPPLDGPQAEALRRIMHRWLNNARLEWNKLPVSDKGTTL
jgi:hypothetical protein